MNTSDPVNLLSELISCASVTPADAGAQTILKSRLSALGAEIIDLPSGNVNNFWARIGTSSPLLVFYGHTDVVPAGPLEDWQSDPFTATVTDGIITGRGAADMKGGVAAFISAVERFMTGNQNFPGSLGFIITSGEECGSEHGTPVVVKYMRDNDLIPDYCIVAEPTSSEVFGDVIKNGRRGSLSGKLVAHGIQGHVAWPDRCVNPILRMAEAIAQLSTERWDEGNDFFPPTSFQITRLVSNSGADNIVPGRLEADWNFRYSSASTSQGLIDRVEQILSSSGLQYDVSWNEGAIPVLAQSERLIGTLSDIILKHTGIRPRLATDGGVTDTRHIAPLCPEVLEFGLLSGTIHKPNEQVSVASLECLTMIFEDLIEKLLG